MVQFEEIYQASLAFKSINMMTRESNLRAYFSKNKFCIHFIRGNNCRKYNCPFIHDDLQTARYFYKEDLNAEYFEDTMAVDELHESLDVYLEEYWEKYRVKKRKKMGLPDPNQPEEEKKVDDDGAQGSKKENREGSKNEEENYEEEEEEEYNPYFLTIKDVILNLEILLEEDFDEKEKEIDEELAAEKKKLEEGSKMDSAEYEQLVEDFGMLVQPDLSKTYSVSYQVGKKVVLDEYMELDILIRKDNEQKQMRDNMNNARLALQQQLKANMPMDEENATEPQDAEPIGNSNQKNEENARFDIGENLNKFNNAKNTQNYNSQGGNNDAEFDSQHSFQDSRRSKRSNARSKSYNYLPDPEEIIQRNNKFFFESIKSSMCSDSSCSQFDDISPYDNANFNLEDQSNEGEQSSSHKALSVTDYEDYQNIQLRAQRRPCTWALNQSIPMDGLESRLDWLEIMSPSVAEASLQYQVKPKLKEISIKKKLQMAKKNKMQKAKDKKKEVQKKPIHQLSREDYLYQIRQNYVINGEVYVENVNYEESETEESPQKNSESLQATAHTEQPVNIEEKLQGTFQPNDNILNPGTGQQFFQTENTFNGLMVEHSPEPSTVKDESVGSESKSKQKKSKAATVVQSQEVSIFAGKAARRKKKKQKKKKKNAQRQKKKEQSKPSQSKDNSTTNRLDSISIVTDRIDNNETTMQSKISQQDITTMSQVDEAIQDLDIKLPVKPLRKQSDVIITSAKKYNEKKELEKIKKSKDDDSSKPGKDTTDYSIEEPNHSVSNIESNPKTENGTEASTLLTQSGIQEDVESNAQSNPKKKRKRKKKNKKKKAEEAQIDLKSSSVTLESTQNQQETKSITEPVPISSQNSENLNMFLKEDAMDIMANKINEIIETEDPFQAIFDILDGPFMETSHEIYVERDEKKKKIVFIGDKRAYAGALFQKLYDNSGRVADE